MTPDDEKDERLAQLLDGLVEGSRHGKQPELEAVISANPDLAAELRELWATAMIAEDFASFSGELSNFTRGGVPPELKVAPATRTAVSLPREAGDYELLEEIGRGGMGVVFKAQAAKPESHCRLQNDFAG